MAETPITAEDVQNVLHAWSELKAYSTWAVVAMVAIAAIVIVIRSVLANHKEERIERRKDTRQKMYLAAIQRLGADIHEHMDHDAEAMDKVSEALDEMKTICATILDRQSGKLEMEPSLKVVEIFFSSIAANASTIIGRSLDENDYEGRKAVVAAKVKTALARIIDDAIMGLSSVALSFDHHYFFRTYEDAHSGGMRYVLCDQMWEAVESLFQRHEEQLRPRLEEMRINLSNTVRDQFSHIARAMLEKRTAPVLNAKPLLPLKASA